MRLATPSGFRDILNEEASSREHIVRRVQDELAMAGYKPIETPTLEAMDVMSAGRRLATSPFKFFDSQGDLLAMRPDVTMQVARISASMFASGQVSAEDGTGNLEEPIKLRYTQRVFREDDGSAQATSREITQIGAECIGDDDVNVDVELVRLLMESLQLAGVSKVCIALANVKPLRLLLRDSGASQSWAKLVMDAFHTSDMVKLASLTGRRQSGSGTSADKAGMLSHFELPQEVGRAYADAIFELSQIHGGMDALEQARRLLEPLGCDEGLDRLKAVADAMSAMGAAFVVDFSLASSFDYYTGIVFEAYSPYTGTALGSGGRYDHMISSFGPDLSAAGFAFCLEEAMAANAAESESCGSARKLRIAVPKGSLNKDAVRMLKASGLDVSGLKEPGRQLIISTDDVDYIIVRPSDAPSFVAAGAADCGICGKDSILESRENVVELSDLRFGECKFVVAEPKGQTDRIMSRYKKLGSMRIATKYPNITRAYFARTGIQVDIVKLHGNIELAPLTGIADRIVDITATGTTLRENDLEVVEDVMSSTARFIANPCSLRTNPSVWNVADGLERAVGNESFEPIAGAAM